jgi:catechol 2,3-dioxygenase-like lactoylglutathione lyase family enzyme
MIYEMNHAGLFVRDLEAALAFYCEALGAREVWRSVIPATRTHVVYVLLGGALIELLAPEEPDPEQVWGLNHIAFLSDALDDDYRRLEASGYEMLVYPRAAGSGVGRLAFLSDPSGARIELLERDLVLRSPAEAASASICVSVRSSSPEQSGRFYAEMVGMTPAVPEALAPRFRAAGGSVEIVPHSEQLPPLDRLTIGVRSVPQMLARLGQDGPRVTDPDGVVVELVDLVQP